MLTQIVAEHGPDGQSSRLLTLVAGVLVFALDEPRGETTARLARICRAKRKSPGPGSPSVVPAGVVLVAAFVEPGDLAGFPGHEIGEDSCRERVCQAV